MIGGASFYEFVALLARFFRAASDNSFFGHPWGSCTRGTVEVAPSTDGVVLCWQSEASVVH